MTKWGLSTNGIVHKMVGRHYKCNGAVGPRLQRKKINKVYQCCVNCWRRKK